MEEIINNEVETDLSSEIDKVIEDNDLTTDSEVEDAEIDFDYDENGDIIIPENDEKSVDDEADEEQDTPVDDTPKEPENEAAVEPASEPDEKDREIYALRRKLSTLEKQSKDTLKKLGVDTDDAMTGLIKLAAEADEISPEEYVRRKTEAERNEEARRFLQASEFQKKIKADLAEVQAAYPETKAYDHITKIPNFKRFAECRDLGLSPKEAFIAANPDSVRAHVATAAKKQSLNETKSHLKPVVSKESKDTSTKISKKELSEYRELFPNMSDKEIVSLYRQAKKK